MLYKDASFIGGQLLNYMVLKAQIAFHIKSEDSKVKEVYACFARTITRYVFPPFSYGIVEHAVPNQSSCCCLKGLTSVPSR